VFDRGDLAGLPRVSSAGATCLIVVISPVCSAAKSSHVSVAPPPPPCDGVTPRVLWFVTIKTFVPMLWNTCLTACCAPSPLATIAITAPMPKMMPSIVSSVRTLLRHSARSASLNVVRMLMRPSPP
jgi:hypothetical protein